MWLRPASTLYDRTVLKVEGGTMVNSPATCARVNGLTADPFGVIAKEPHARGVVVDHQGAADPPGAARVEIQMPV